MGDKQQAKGQEGFAPLFAYRLFPGEMVEIWL